MWNCNFTFQEKNSNLNRDSSFGSPDLEPGALPFELSWYNRRHRSKPLCWKQYLLDVFVLWPYLTSIDLRTNFIIISVFSRFEIKNAYMPYCGMQHWFDPDEDEFSISEWDRCQLRIVRNLYIFWLVMTIPIWKSDKCCGLCNAGWSFTSVSDIGRTWGQQ